jgi:hypothetical protein
MIRNVHNYFHANWSYCSSGFREAAGRPMRAASIWRHFNIGLTANIDSPCSARPGDDGNPDNLSEQQVLALLD